MIDNLEAFIIFILCDIKFSSVIETRDGKWKHNYKLVPRKYTMIPTCVLITPIFVLINGISEVPKMFRDILKETCFSSYNIITDDKDAKPTKWECYKKY